MSGQHVLALAYLEEHLRRQVAYLRRSAAAYDEGATDEAFRLATTVRVLCHQTANSRSLLHQLGLLPERLRFVNTALQLPDLPPGAFAINMGLCTIRLNFDAVTADPTPVLDDLGPDRTNPLQAFDEWWRTPFLTNESPLRGRRGAFTYSRRNVVLQMANKDGGAHVDPQMPDHYRAVVDHDGVIGLVVNGQQVSIPRRAFVTAWMRQIAHEVQRTLEHDFCTRAILEGRPSGLAPEWSLDD
ncbi:hypothetical protein GA0074695_1010 [Micromonospora viridifaciens]|uniref:Uncharacterized protein n=1 Tax=Micromonospora viridifaciens TaxID=1881 RepID=A0A1C4V0K2_MICVI|nr:hypothetical protein [Micromonospora viridifaciens]SCE77502.1 hypothetical protein GA0074695_1010 [Micromonospora viridifaciens]